MSNQVEEEIRQLRGRLDQLSRLIEKHVSDGTKVACSLQDQAVLLGKKLRGCCDEWLLGSEEKLTKIKSDAEQGVKKIREGVNNNPIMSLGISALIGFVIACLFSCRKR